MNRPRTYQEWLRRRQPPPQKPEPKTLKDRLWECWSGFLICVCYAIILSPFYGDRGTHRSYLETFLHRGYNRPCNRPRWLSYRGMDYVDEIVMERVIELKEI